jgi:hypothetical protein
MLNLYEMILTSSTPIFTIIEGYATANIIIICRDRVRQLLEQDEEMKVK